MSSTLDHQKPQANNSSSSIDEEEAIGAGRQLNRNITPGGHPLDRTFPGFGTSHRKFGDPGPLGLCSFALPTFVLSLISLGTNGVHTSTIVAGIAIGYGGLGQLLAGMWEFASGNTLGATIFSSYGGFWLSIFFILSPWSGIATSYKSAAELEAALGFFIFGWFIFTFIILVASLRSSAALISLLVVLEVTFATLGASYFATPGSAMQVALTKASGGAGIVLAAHAWYIAAAQLINPTTSYFSIPLGSLARTD